jgi:hypothetical protein
VNANSIFYKTALLSLAVATLALSGCVLAPIAAVGATAAGVGTADDAKLAKLTARNFGTEIGQVTVSNVKKDNSLFGSTIYCQADIKSAIGTRTMNCMITSSYLVDSAPLCAKPGEPLTGGGDSCNALSKAAGKC